MKTYLFEKINQYKALSEKLDAKAILSNKVWRVFNDSNEKQVYIFQDNGTVLVTTNGIGTKMSWEYLTANKSIIIKNSDNSFVMLHPAFVTQNVLVFKLDGTERCAFMIDENCLELSCLKSISDIEQYFIELEQKKLSLTQQEKSNQEAQRVEEIDRKKARQKYGEISEDALKKTSKQGLKVLVICNIIISIFLLVFYLAEHSIPSYMIGICIGTNLAIIAIFLSFINLKNEHDLINKYKRSHPNESYIKYL